MTTENFLTIPIPQFECFLRTEFLHNLEPMNIEADEYKPCLVWGLSSVEGRALGFHVLLSNGAMISRVPIHALCHMTDAPNYSLEMLQLWDCFSYYVGINPGGYVNGAKFEAILKNGDKCLGDLMFIIEWGNSAQSENVGDAGYKTANFISLDNGCFCALPNNRVKCLEPSFVTEPFDTPPTYKTNTHVWKAETESKWMTENSDAFYYNIERNDDEEGEKTRTETRN